jgi:Fatty acid hydroxylase
MWSTTFERFSPGRIPLVGPVVVAVYDWARPKSGESVMFEHIVLERLSVAHPAWPLAIYVTSGAAAVAAALVRGAGAATIAAAYAGGWLLWSLVEHVMHRFSFHHSPTTTRQVAFGYVVHGVHHAFPEDPRRWMIPIAVSIPITALLLAFFYGVGGLAGLAVFGGFMHGYITYDTLHWAIHRNVLGTRAGRFLRRHHMQHHYATPHRRFGVSTPLWDVFFGTLR